MKDDVQRRVQRYGWDRAAGHYQFVWQRPLQPAHERLLRRAALQPGMRVLEVVCGTGLVTFSAADAVAPSGEIMATDVSEGMIERGRSNAEARGIENVEFERMDAEALDLPDGGFDIVLCSLGLMYVPNPEEALREMHRVLAPGGKAVAVVWGKRRNCGWADVFPIVDRRVQSDVCPLFFRLGTGTTLEAGFRAAGFNGVTSNRFRTGLPFDSEDDACEAIFEGGPVALAWCNFDKQTRAGARAKYLDSIAEYRAGDGYLIPGEFVLVGGANRRLYFVEESLAPQEP